MSESQTQHWLPLPRPEVIRALERQGPSRIAMVRAKWWGEGLRAQFASFS